MTHTLGDTEGVSSTQKHVVNSLAALATAALREVSLQLHRPSVTRQGHPVPKKELIVPNNRRCESEPLWLVRVFKCEELCVHINTGAHSYLFLEASYIRMSANARGVIYLYTFLIKFAPFCTWHRKNRYGYCCHTGEQNPQAGLRPGSCCPPVGCPRVRSSCGPSWLRSSAHASLLFRFKFSRKHRCVFGLLSRVRGHSASHPVYFLEQFQNLRVKTM